MDASTGWTNSYKEKENIQFRFKIININFSCLKLVIEFTWCSNPGHTLEGIYEYPSKVCSGLLYQVNFITTKNQVLSMKNWYW